MSWELWAAFVEVFGQASDGAEVTPKLVWQRAMELGHQTDSFTGGAGQQHVHPNTDIDAGGGSYYNHFNQNITPKFQGCRGVTVIKSLVATPRR